jgi:L-2-hydroxyglutarate oxidase LhgO
MDEIDCAVIGGGVVGLAVARALALAGREVLVLETEGAIGTGTSSRNSEVIHAGIYYPQGSLKARLCVEGKDLLYAYAAERGVPHRRCGKFIVATSPSRLGSSKPSGPRPRPMASTT